MKINENIHLEALSIDKANDYYLLTQKDKEQLKDIFNSITDTSTAKDEENFIKNLLTNNENFYIFYKNELCGKIGVYRYNKEENSYEIYYYVNSKYRGKKIIETTLKPFIKYVFNELNANTIKFYINTDNIASNKIVNNLNINFIKTIKNKDFCNNKYHDQNLYIIKRTT